MRQRFWMSWYEVTSPEHPGDYRPFTVPLPKEILGWWCSGYTMEDQPRFTICAHVEADSPEDAWQLLRKYWNLGEVRFCDEVAQGWKQKEQRKQFMLDYVDEAAKMVRRLQSDRFADRVRVCL